MAKETEKPAETDNEDSDSARIKQALTERLTNLKEQIKRTEALPDSEQHKAQNLLTLKQHLSDLQKDLK
jgi:hypothetical protein